MTAQPEIFDSILDTIGNTPLVRLPNIAPGLVPTLLAKVEYLNPGGSIKDRAALSMIAAAEADGSLKPGGTIVEPTSGNTGTGLAMAARLKGYKVVAVMPDKMSQEKIDLLRAYGAEVVICPTNVEPDDPRSYYQVANRLAAEIPGAFQPNQYHNQANPNAHYVSTGPEIWRQTAGKITHLVVGVGTGGTISGTARYLKEQNPNIKVIGADPEGSIYSDPSDVHSYLIEGVGEDFYPTAFDPSVVDEYVRVSDKDAFVMTRKLAEKEGLLVGGSCGMAVVAAIATAQSIVDPEAVVVVVLPDGGRAYISKIFSDEWMSQHGMLAKPVVAVGAVLRAKQTQGQTPTLLYIGEHQTVREAVELFAQHSVSQLPVVTHAGKAKHRLENADTDLQDLPFVQDQGYVTGAISESQVLRMVAQDPTTLDQFIWTGSQEPAFPVLGVDVSVEQALALLSKEQPALLVVENDVSVGVITRDELLEATANQ